MSMYRQLWLAIILSTTLALIGSLLASILNSQAYLNEQLRVKNLDNANVLAMSLSQKNIDKEDLSLLITALFDGGHYTSIRVTDPAGKMIVERTVSDVKTNVPSWFMKNVPLYAAPGQAQISNGWKQIGTISLMSETGSAYQILWRSTREMIITLALSGLIAGYLGTCILRRLKRPLSAVVEQAKGMSERHFTIIPEPAVPELRQLSIAMNSTATLLKSMFSEEAERLEALRKQANTDLVTGLSNRSHFMVRLQYEVEEENAPPGSLIMLRISHLGEINKKIGRNNADGILKKIATLLQAQQDDLIDGFSARLNGTDFVLLFRQSESEVVAKALLKTISAELDQIADRPASVFIGFGKFEYGINPAVLLSELDMAVASAEIDGASGVRIASPLMIEQAPRSAEEWAKLIERALEQKWVKLALFPVADFSGIVGHRESALRLMFGGEWFPAGRFLPIAERLGLTQQLDLAAVTLALEELSSNKNGADIAVNISAQSIHDANFRERLRALLLAKPAESRRLWLEVPERGAFASMDVFSAFCQKMRPCVGKIGLEHFGRCSEQINLVHELKLDFVKIDGSFIRGIEQNLGNQGFVKGIAVIIHRMGLQIFAEGVNSEVDLKMLESIGLDGVTGLAVSKVFHLQVDGL